ncbi:MAG: UDP-glucose 4-epimerase [Saprospiraceae bacterium]
MKKIIVTGGTGYIGSHTVIELLNNDYDVHIIDNLSNSDISMHDRIEKIAKKRPLFTQIDLRDKTEVNDFFNSITDVEGVIHFAALKSVGESVKMPVKYYENNVIGLCNLLTAIESNDIQNLVFSSSATVYGSPKSLPVTENSPLGYTPSPYGATKQMCERVIEDFTYANSNFKAMSLRYFNPIGAHDSGLIGELPTGIPNNLMPYITQTSAGLRDQLSVFGTDYSTPDGTAIRDYIHVSDVAAAHVHAIDFLTANSENKHYKLNVGTGIGLSVLEVIKSFEKTSGIKLNYILTDRREGDVEAVYANVSYAQDLLSWKAKYGIDQMTKSAWLWEKAMRGID